MIFSAEQVRLILIGRKTQARRLAIHRKGLPEPSLADSELERLRSTSHRVDRVYPLERQVRGDELRPEERMQLETGRKRSVPLVTVGHIRCTDLQLKQLGDIDIKDALAEGFRTTEEFKAAWVRQHEHQRPARPPSEETIAWRIRRMAIGIHDHRQGLPDCEQTICDALTRRFDAKHADRLVWVLSLTVVETPRLLRASASFDDYTDTPSRAARSEPEALTEDQLVALHRFAAARDDARRRAPLTTLAESIARDLDEFVGRMPDEGLADRSTKKTLRAISYHVEELRRKMEVNAA